MTYLTVDTTQRAFDLSINDKNRIFDEAGQARVLLAYPQKYSAARVKLDMVPVKILFTSSPKTDNS